MSYRIVIITYNWPPRNAIGTHRPYSWARHWNEAGMAVTVLTAEKQPFDKPLDLSLPTLPDVNVVQVPYPSRGKVVGKLFESNFLLGIARKLKNVLRFKLGVANDPRMAWRTSASVVAAKLAFEADIVVSTFGPPVAHLIGYDMKLLNPNLIWVADYRDLWSGNHINIISKRMREYVENMELKTVGEKADIVSAVSKDMVDKLAALLKKEVFEFPNGFDADEEFVRENVLRRNSRFSRPFRIVYTGTVYEGHQDPSPLFEVLVELYREGVIGVEDVIVEFYGERMDLVKRLALNSSYKSFIKVMGHVGRDQALAVQRSADALLLLESSEPEAKGVLTGKIFEYIAAGRPILCVGSRPEYEIGKLLLATGTGCVFGPSQYYQLKNILKETINGAGLYEITVPKIDVILEYSRKRQSQKFLEKVVSRIEKLSD